MKFKLIIATTLISLLTACGGGESVVPVCENSEKMLELVNAVRTKGQFCGGVWYAPVQPLSISPYLQSTAGYFSNDLAVHKIEAGHIDSKGVHFYQRVQGYAGENSAAGTTGAEGTNQAFVDSSGHCANLMHAAFTQFGSSCSVSTHGREYWVQHFSN